MAPGIGGFNIDPPPHRAKFVNTGVAVEEMRDRSGPNLRLIQRPSMTERFPMTSSNGGRSLVLKVSASIGIMAVALLLFPNVVGELVSDLPKPIAAVRDRPDAAPSFKSPHLIIENQKGLATEPLPLGISVEFGSGAETVTIAGLAEGTELSLGTWMSGTGWLVPIGDLGKAFVGAPPAFVGVMIANVTLRSANGQRLDNQTVRFEWSERENAQPASALALASVERSSVQAPEEPVSVDPPLRVDQIALLIQLGEDLVKNGDIVSARLLFKRAALAGSDRAALALGQTFDEAILTDWGVVGVAPDAARAREWYDRAIKLGSTKAAGYLERLAGIPK
jgi:hypothetical protein